MKRSLSFAYALALAIALLLPFAVPAAADLLAFPGATAPLIAFPGADGVGKYTVGGRGGAVYEVTTLEDYDGSTEDVIPGSLREAIEAEGPRTIVFDVAGTIELKTNLRVKNGWLTIAGQTAPGQGITLKNYEFSIQADEVIVRCIRIRTGGFRHGDGMNIKKASNVIVDHCSVSWGVDETFSLKKADNVTVQWCFITEGLHKSVHKSGRMHSKGSLVNGLGGQAVSLHHNLWAHNDARSPRLQGAKPPEEDPIGFFCDVTNNVMYDWGRGYPVKNADRDTICTINLVGNYMIAGRSSNASNFMLDRNINSRMYLEGNYMNGRQPADQYKKISYLSYINPSFRRAGKAKGWKLETPFDGGMSDIESAETAYARVMAHGGAALHRDAVDQRIASDVLAGTGRIIDKPSQVGGWPALDTGPTWTDTAKAAWEAEYGFDPYTEKGAEAGPDGYTYLENFLNSLMEGLYEEDIPIPEFSGRWRWFHHIAYRFRRLPDDVWLMCKDAWITVTGLFK